MIALAVEQLQADLNPMILRNLLYAVQPSNRVARALFIRDSASVPRERDYIRYACLRGPRDVYTKCLFNRGMILHTIESLPDFPTARVSHGTNQSITPRNFIRVRLQQVNAAQPDFRSVLAQFFERNVRVTPLTDGLMNPSLAHRSCRIIARRGRRNL